MGKIIPFPVWIIPFPVLKINLIRDMQVAIKVKIAKGGSVSE